MNTTVTYTPYGGSATILNPPPFVSQSRQPIDAGALRLGQIEEYELDGVSSRDIASLSNIFSKSPGRLVVNSNNSIILEKDDLYVTLFSIPQNDNNAKAITTTLGLSAGSAAIPYKVKFKKIVSLSGIKDPSFEYNFTQNEDKSVNLNMKAAAVGIHSISSAQTFVDGLLPNTFNPSAFAPIYIRTAAAWSLLSNKKTVDRSKFSYSIERSYRCNPSGYISVPNFPFTETTTVSNQSNVNEDYETYQFESNLKLHNPTGWNAAENLFTRQNYIENISKHYLKRYDATNSDALFNNTFLDNVSVSKNQEAGEVNLKWQLLVGAPDHFKGYFDYSVLIDEDLSLGENSVSLDGSFISKGDLTNRKEYLDKWLARTYTPPGVITNATASQNITPLINAAPNYNLLARNLLTAGTHSMTAGVQLNLNSIQVSVDHNSGLADFKLSCSANNSTDPFLGAKINFKADVQQSIPIRKFSQSANIEGHYILQDFNCNSLEKASLKVNVDADSAHFNNGTLKPIAIAIMGHMFNSFVKKGNAAPALDNYMNLVPENLQISSEPGGGLAINYDLMYAKNKTCNYNVITSGPMNAAAATVAVPASTRSAYPFGR